MRFTAGCFRILLLLLAAAPAAARAQVDEVVQGYLSGQTAGTRPTVVVPWGVSTATITVLAAIDNEPVTNNRVVGAAVVNAAIGAGVSYVVGRIARPEPTPLTQDELRARTSAYREGFRRGFNESLGGRQLVANLLGVVTGSLIGGAIYFSRRE